MPISIQRRTTNGSRLRSSAAFMRSSMAPPVSPACTTRATPAAMEIVPSTTKAMRTPSWSGSRMSAMKTSTETPLAKT